MELSVLNILLFVSAIILSFYAITVSEDVKDETNEVSDLVHSSDAFIEGLDEFSEELFHIFTKDSPGKNIFLSPYSIKQALGLLFLGSDGKTSKDLKEGLHLSDMDRNIILTHFKELRENTLGDSDSIASSNELWIDHSFPIKKEYLYEAKKYFDSSSTNMNFQESEQSRMKINEKIEEFTNKKITDLLPRNSITSNTVLVITNAIHFLGEWMNEFNEKLTSDAPFTLVNGDIIDIPMMKKTASFRAGKKDNMWILELPYSDKENSMIIYFPEDMSNFDYTVIPEAVDIESLSSQKIGVSLPKFSIDSSFSLKELMKNTSFSSIFDRCDLSFINDSNQLMVSEIFHNAYVQINEKGTEAAGATAVVVDRGLPSLPILELNINHPFIFSIQNLITEEVLFSGVVHNPLLK